MLPDPRCIIIDEIGKTCEIGFTGQGEGQTFSARPALQRYRRDEKLSRDSPALHSGIFRLRAALDEHPKFKIRCSVTDPHRQCERREATEFIVEKVGRAWGIVRSPVGCNQTEGWAGFPRCARAVSRRALGRGGAL